MQIIARKSVKLANPATNLISEQRAAKRLHVSVTQFRNMSRSLDVPKPVKKFADEALWVTAELDAWAEKHDLAVQPELDFGDSQ